MKAPLDGMVVEDLKRYKKADEIISHSQRCFDEDLCGYGGRRSKDWEFRN